MKRTIVLACCASLLVLEASILARQVPPSKTTTVTATIEAIDTATRVVTLKGSAGQLVEVTAPAELQGFNNLRVGDHVTATSFDADVVNANDDDHAEGPHAWIRNATSADLHGDSGVGQPTGAHADGEGSERPC